jgi:hypothetical protein
VDLYIHSLTPPWRSASLVKHRDNFIINCGFKLIQYVLYFLYWAIFSLTVSRTKNSQNLGFGRVLGTVLLLHDAINEYIKDTYILYGYEKCIGVYYTKISHRTFMWYYAEAKFFHYNVSDFGCM